jgi:hypothetical protein
MSGRQPASSAAENLRARLADIAAAGRRALRQARSAAAARRPVATADRLAKLERRVRELEAELAEMRGAAAAGRQDNAVELARPAGRR